MPRAFKKSELEAFQALANPVWVFDIDKQHMWWANHRAVELWNADSLDALLARDYTDLSESTRQRLANYQRVFKRGETLREQWTFFPKGEPKTVICDCSGILIEEGRMALMIEARPAADSEAAPNALRATEALNHTRLITSLFTLEGDLLFQNPAADRAFGRDIADFVSRFVDRDLARRALDDVLRGETVSIEAECQTLNGQRWHGVDCRLIRDPATGAQAVLCNRRDIDDLKHTQLALTEAKIRAEESAEVKSRFLANMSHEIRTPLNGVLGLAQLLKTEPLSPRQSEYVDYMMDSAKSLRVIIDDILDFSKMEAGHIELDRHPFCPERLFQSCLHLVRPMAQTKGLALRGEFEGDKTDLNGDETRLRQVLMNLLSNAVKFTDHGEIRFQAALRVPETGMAELRFTVADTGPGIEKRDHAKLFTRFTQVDDSLKRRREGAGLGLAIARELISLMDGEIELESQPGKGSAFSVRVALPVSNPVKKQPDSFDEDSQAELRVLVAEDNRVNQMVIEKFLKALGHRTMMANHGLEALALLDRHEADIALLDIMMPEMDGLDTARAIRGLPGSLAKIPIVAVSANAMKDDRDAYLAGHFDDYLAKPIEMDSLKKLLAKWSPVDRRP